MANSERLKALVEPTESSKSSRLKGLLEPSAASQFVSGLRRPVETFLASAFGSRFDPATGEIPEVPTPEPDSFSGRVGQGISEAVLMALPMGAVATKIQRPTQEVGRVQSAIRNFGADIGENFARSPTKFVAAEGGLGALSAAGGYAAEQAFPESDAARFIGEILGGMSPQIASGAGRGAVRAVDAATDYMPAVGAAKNYVAKTWDEVRRTVDARTAGERARERFGRALGDTDAEAVIGSMDEALLPEARALMTPAQIAGHPGLLSIEKSLAETTDSLRNKREEDLIRLNEILQGSLKVGGDVGKAAQAIERTRQDYVTLLNARVQLAAKKAEEGLQRMIPSLGEEGANRIARSELETALRQANAQERELYALVDPKADVPTARTVDKFRELKAEYGRLGEPSIPGYARKFFDPTSSSFIGKTTNVNELRQAQSQLREIQRQAEVGANPDRKMARFARLLADSITDDLALAAGDNPEAIRNAVNFSRAKNEVFSQGTVGKILRTAADSGDAVPEMLTLNRTLGLMGSEGAQAFDEMLSAATMARERAGYEGADNLAGAMQSFIQNEFMKSTVRGGQVDPTLAQTFLRNNDVLLQRFPEIKQNIQNAMQTQNASEAAQLLRSTGSKAFLDPEVSKAALLINKGPEAAFKSVFEARNPSQEMKSLVEMVRRDTTGEALSGLKQGFYDYLVDAATVNGALSGRQMSEITRNSKVRSAMDELLNKQERERLDVIVRTAQRVDLARNARASSEGVSGDALSKTSEALLGVLGAAYGRQVSTRMGGGTIQIPGIFANKFREMGMSGLVNPAKRLIIDALQDEKLFRQVLMAKPDEKGDLPKESVRRLNAWAAGALAHEFGPQEEE